MRHRRRYTPEQKAEAIRLVVEDGLPPVMVSRQIGIHLSNISRWVLDAERAEQTDPRACRRALLSRT